MDRQIVYPGAIPQDVDQLKQNKNAMIGLGYALQAILGTSTLVDGLACNPTSPASLNVTVGPGSIYGLQNVDGTAYGSLAADTTDQIVKQGIIMSTQTFNCPAPSTSGFSVVYLVEAAYEDVDGGSTVLPYYNASNPSQAYNGPNNTGTSQNTVRQGVCQVQVKTGIAATTGTQVTPSPDAGFTGLYAITVANGQVTITSGNIVQLSTAPFISPKLGAFIQAIQNGTGVYVADTSVSANTITIAPSPAFQSLGAGAKVRIKIANTTTGPTVINTNGGGNVSVKMPGGGDPPPKAMVANGIYEFAYDGTNWELQTTPASGISSTSSVTGASHTYAAADTGLIINRSNSGTLMTDTLPGTGTAVLAAGWRAVVKNIDSSALLYISVGSGANLDNSSSGTIVLGPGQQATIVSDGSNYWTIELASRARLGANTNFYVATTGSDSSSGLASGTPWLTIQHAINFIANNIDLNGFTATINVADGTYTTGLSVASPWVGNGNVLLNGDTAVPANCIISTTGVDCVDVSNGAILSVQGFKLTTTTAGNCLNAFNAGQIILTGNMNFGACAAAHMLANINGIIESTVNYTISGNALEHCYCNNHGSIIYSGAQTITLSGTPAFTDFAYANDLSLLTIGNNTFTGSATGARYNVGANSVIQTNSGGASYLPGNASGTTSGGGEYL